MKKNIVLVGSLDTKGDEFQYVKDILVKQGLQTTTVDFGIMHQSAVQADIPRETVIEIGGGDLGSLADRQAQG